MTKRILIVLLSILLVCGQISVSGASDMDLSLIRQSDSLYSIDVNTEDDVAFIESQLSAQMRSFVHKYESSSQYSTTQFDILVVNYLKTNAFPVMRLWITYCADDAYLNISSVSFIMNGTKYTFSGIADSDWYHHDENGYREQVLIKFGTDNLSFLAAMESLFNDVEDADGLMDMADDNVCRLILHGREDIEVELGYGFYMDFLIIKTGMVSINGLSFLDKANSSVMKETKVP